jgi:hypothetical protein
VLAYNIAAWNFVHGINETGLFHKSLMAAFFTRLGFFFPGDLGSTVWQKHTWKVFWIGYRLSLCLSAGRGPDHYLLGVT